MYDSGVMANFVQESQSSVAQISNMDIGMLGYFGHILEIMKINFKKFEIFIFDMEWFKVMVRGPNATMCKGKSGLIQVNTRKVWQDQQDTFVLPKHCNQVVFVNEP